MGGALLGNWKHGGWRASWELAVKIAWHFWAEIASAKCAFEMQNLKHLHFTQLPPHATCNMTSFGFKNLPALPSYICQRRNIAIRSFKVRHRARCCA